MKEEHDAIKAIDAFDNDVEVARVAYLTKHGGGVVGSVARVMTAEGWS